MKRETLVATAILALTIAAPSHAQSVCTPVPIQIPFAVKGKIEITDCLQSGYYSDRYSTNLSAGAQITLEATAPSTTTLSWITIDIQRWIPSGPSFGWNRVLEKTEFTPERNALKFDFAAPFAADYLFLITGGSSVGEYNFSIKPLSSNTGPSVAAVLAVVGSAPGNGAYFRTAVQIQNPRTSSISGKFVFHTQGATGNDNDPSLAYTLGPGQTIEYPDLLPSMGIASGLGSLDIMTSGDPAPIVAARVFSDGGDSGTSGFFIEPVAPQDALQAGENAVIIAPANPTTTRLNLGVRTLDGGASFSITVRNKNGVVRGSRIKTYGATYFEQVNANTLVGLTLDGSDSITFSMIAGKAIIYGAQTDNRTQDPSVQYAKRTF